MSGAGWWAGARGTWQDQGVGVMFALFGAGFLVMFLGLLEGGISPLHTLLKFVGIALMSVGVLGSAAIGMHRRQRERKQQRRELARR